jgi:putative FmdB family regulatory protein
VKVYDYLCKTCQKREERWVKTPEDVVACSRCGSVHMTRLPPATKTTFRFADKRP